MESFVHAARCALAQHPVLEDQVLLDVPDVAIFPHFYDFSIRKLLKSKQYKLCTAKASHLDSPVHLAQHQRAIGGQLLPGLLGMGPELLPAGCPQRGTQRFVPHCSPVLLAAFIIVSLVLIVIKDWPGFPGSLLPRVHPALHVFHLHEVLVAGNGLFFLVKHLLNLVEIYGFHQVLLELGLHPEVGPRLVLLLSSDRYSSPVGLFFGWQLNARLALLIVLGCDCLVQGRARSFARIEVEGSLWLTLGIDTRVGSGPGLGVEDELRVAGLAVEHEVVLFELVEGVDFVPAHFVENGRQELADLALVGGAQCVSFIHSPTLKIQLLNRDCTSQLDGASRVTSLGWAFVGYQLCRITLIIIINCRPASMKSRTRVLRPAKKHKPISQQVHNCRKVSKLRRFVNSCIFTHKVSSIITNLQANPQQVQKLGRINRNKYLIAVVVRALVSAYRLHLEIYLYSLLVIHRLTGIENQLRSHQVQERAGAVFLLAARVFGQSRGFVLQNLAHHFEGVQLGSIERVYRKTVRKAQGIPILEIIRQEQQAELIYQIEKMMIQKVQKQTQEPSWCSKQAEETRDSHQHDCNQQSPPCSKTM